MYVCVCLCACVLLDTKLGALCTLGKSSTTEMHHHPNNICWNGERWKQAPSEPRPPLCTHSFVHFLLSPSLLNLMIPFSAGLTDGMGDTAITG